MNTSLISQDPEIMSGALCFTGTRVLVKCLFDYLEGSSTLDEFLDDFPSVSRETAVAVLEAARQQLTAEVLELHNFQSDLLESVKQMRRGQASMRDSMTDLKYQPVPHDHKAFLAKAHQRPGFSEAYEALAGAAMLNSGAVPNEVVNIAFERGVSPMAAWREHLGLTQAEIAARIGIAQAGYARMERVKQPRKTTLEKVAAAMGLEVEQLRW